MSNYGDQPQNPEPSGQDPNQPPNPYGQPAQGSPYGQPGQQNPYAAPQQPNPYGGAPQDNPYGQQPNPYGAPPNPYAAMPGAQNFASWGQRVGAYLIDALLTSLAAFLYIIGLIMTAASTKTTTDPVTGMTTTTGSPNAVGLILILLGLLCGLAFFIWNTCIKGGGTGYSIGKGVMGIKLIKEQTGQPIGAGMAFVRYLCHILDGLPCYVGYLWPLWDQKRQTFADKIVGSVVIVHPKG